MILEILKTGLVSVGLLFWLGCSITNASVFINWITKGLNGSNIPLIGGIIGSISCVLAPWEIFNAHWWIPLILDLSYLMCIIGIIRCLFSKSKED
jgi:CHASE2 domain-containing sensor protein